MQDGNDANSERLAVDATTELFREYIRSRDPVVRDRLVLAHQNLVRFLAGKFANRGIPLEDLVQVGMIGLINAVDRFDPDRGIQFSTYATPTIVGEIRRYFRDKAWSLKVPRRLQELNLKITKAADALSSMTGRTPSIQEIAAYVEASEEDTLEAMELGNAYDTVSLDTPLQGDGESGPMSLAEFLGETDASIADIESHSDLTQALNALEPREKAIIYYRFFGELSQTEVAKRLNISQMHVSRLQKKAMARLKELLQSQHND
ncbi:MAG: SigB/SigF/SigG family RNA polymerase sigma factor [Armatimonadota bacterium]|nr:SigB/SigF/SigG family RNA polymerase sigma factor [bacterium]